MRSGQGKTGATSKAYLVARREYIENIRTKAFWIGIFMFPLLITLSMVVPTLLERAKSARHYAVVDQSGWLLEEVERRGELPDLERVFERALELHREGGEELETLPEELQETARQLDAAITLVGERMPDADPNDVERRAITGFAGIIGGFPGTQGETVREALPPAAVAELDALRGSIQSWWRELPPEDAEAFGSGLDKSRYIRVDVPGSGQEQLRELNERVREGELFAYFVIGENPTQSSDGSSYVSTNLTDDDLSRWFARLASDVVRERRLAEREIDPQVAEWIQQPVEFSATKIGASGEAEEVSTQDTIRQWAPPAFVYILWFTIFFVAQMLLTNTVEEKSNRLMEVLLSSVSPLQLMMGKVAGIAATGLTMVASWAVFFYLAAKYVPQMMGASPGFDFAAIATDPAFMVSFVVYFLLGYLFYAALLVGIGSVCNSLKEAQNLQTPITLVLIIPLLSMIPISQDPNGTLARAMSYFPPFTPFVMMNRAAGPPSTFEYVATGLLLVLSIVAAMWAAAKVFRVGVLMTGKPPKIGEIVRWIGAPVGSVPVRKSPSE